MINQKTDYFENLVLDGGGGPDFLVVVTTVAFSFVFSLLTPDEFGRGAVDTVDVVACTRELGFFTVPAEEDFFIVSLARTRGALTPVEAFLSLTSFSCCLLGSSTLC